MRANEAFELEVQPGDEVLGARMAIVLQREIRDALGRLGITPECTSLDEVEGQINMPQPRKGARPQTGWWLSPERGDEVAKV